MQEVLFLETALKVPGNAWENSSLDQLSSLQVSENVLGLRRTLLRADINREWARWFVESVVDPRQYSSRTTYAQIYSDVLELVDGMFHQFVRPDRLQLASSIAKIIENIVRSMRSVGERRVLPISERRFLLDLNGGQPRCWICKAKFSDTAIDNFLSNRNHRLPLPPFVDLLKPRGLHEQDLRIEVDHVQPFSLGGDDVNNLSLACGWCNRYKAANTSIYDVAGHLLYTHENIGGLNSLPRQFWTVRLLAISSSCEHRNGCDCDMNPLGLTVSPINRKGAINPANLMVCCYDHDPIESIRMQAREKVQKIWNSCR